MVLPTGSPKLNSRLRQRLGMKLCRSATRKGRRNWTEGSGMLADGDKETGGSAGARGTSERATGMIEKVNAQGALLADGELTAHGIGDTEPRSGDSRDDAKFVLAWRNEDVVEIRSVPWICTRLPLDKDFAIHADQQADPFRQTRGVNANFCRLVGIERPARLSFARIEIRILIRDGRTAKSFGRL